MYAKFCDAKIHHIIVKLLAGLLFFYWYNGRNKPMISNDKYRNITNIMRFGALMQEYFNMYLLFEYKIGFNIETQI